MYIVLHHQALTNQSAAIAYVTLFDQSERGYSVRHAVFVTLCSSRYSTNENAAIVYVTLCSSRCSTNQNTYAQPHSTSLHLAHPCAPLRTPVHPCAPLRTPVHPCAPLKKRVENLLHYYFLVAVQNYPKINEFVSIYIK